MSNEITTVKDLIGLWPSRKALTEDLCRRGFRLTLDRVQKWAQTGSVPAKYHLAMILSSDDRGLGVTAADMARLHHAPDDRPDHPPTHHSDSPHEQCQNTDAA